ncbi:MAG TPA: AAA family ATPase, partial [Myxococcota bacterium]|nr:AAA family ATPase [Myxococcota bacterium]
MLYRFGEFELDDERCQLRRGPDPVALQPKAFDLLLYLVRARDRVVTKAELLDRLWPDAIVGGHSVVRAVHALRTALGDQRLPRTYVRSVARKGYRFVAELDAETRAAAASDTAGEPERAGALARARVDLYVGREALLQTLRDELARAFAGETRTLVLEGEAGIGKTRTAEEIARLAREQGAQVLTGWCPENEAAAPFQPWLQILGELVATDAW